MIYDMIRITIQTKKKKKKGEKREQALHKKSKWVEHLAALQILGNLVKYSVFF